MGEWIRYRYARAAAGLSVSAVAAVMVAILAGAAWADDPATPPAKPTSAAANSKSLDLSTPPVNHVLSQTQIQSLTAERDEDGAPPSDVSVEGPRYESPVPQGTFRALGWGIMHPLQAWRIFTPVTN